jgi:hypothetical protein
VKLVLHAAHDYSWGSWAPDIGTFTSLGVIVGVLAVTVVLSLRAVKRDPTLVKTREEHAGEALAHVPEKARPGAH